MTMKNFIYRMFLLKLSMLVLLSLVSSIEIDERLISNILTEAESEIPMKFLSKMTKVDKIPGHARRGITQG